MFFCNSLAFLMIFHGQRSLVGYSPRGRKESGTTERLHSLTQWRLAIWSLFPLPFLNPAWTSGSSQFMYHWNLAWRIWSITLLACEMRAIVRSFKHSLALPFFGIGMREVQIKTAMRYHFTPCRMAITFKILIIDVGKDVEKLKPSYHAGGNLK